jgi:hypothetical protein
LFIALNYFYTWWHVVYLYTEGIFITDICYPL